MEKNTIKCPNCNTFIDINHVLYEQISQQNKQKFESEVQKHRFEYKNAMDKLKDKEQKLKQQDELFEKKLNESLHAKLQKQSLELEKNIKQKLQNEQSLSIKKLQDEILEKTEQVKELHVAKIQMEQLKRELNEATQKVTLKLEQEYNAKFDIQTQKLAKTLQEQNEFKLKQKDEQISQIKRQLEDAKRKTEQVSMQVQGEVGENIIEQYLKQAYVLDEIIEIKKGQRGGDCLQIINTKYMYECGKIYYESKITKDFQPSWIEKFKADILEKKADIGILVTQSMPKNMEKFGLYEGVWVCGFDEFKALSMILRENLIQIAQIQKSKENKTDKMSLLYSYLTSNEFKMQIQAIIEGFTTMQNDLESEKRAMQRIWKQREKQITKVIENTTNMYASIKAIAGNAIAKIDMLELDFIGEDDE